MIIMKNYFWHTYNEPTWRKGSMKPHMKHQPKLTFYIKRKNGIKQTTTKKREIHIINYIAQDLFVRWARTCIALSLALFVCVLSPLMHVHQKYRLSIHSNHHDWLYRCRVLTHTRIDVLHTFFTARSLSLTLTQTAESKWIIIFWWYLFFIPADHNSLTEIRSVLLPIILIQAHP